MGEINKAPRGTNDILPGNIYKWRFIEQKMLETAALFGFKEIRTPVFEHTEVFQRSVGDTTDVVQKEMYTFEDKGGRSITLRPEMTAGVVRSVIEHGEINNALPVKTCYVGSCYRYEKPQAGRLREFHQFGVECFGAGAPAADAEIILLAKNLLASVGITDLSLEINSIGCPVCRKEYNQALRQYFTAHREHLCATCNDRLERNPMRILDCKSPICKEISAQAPVMLEYLCVDCKTHFDEVQAHLKAAQIHFIVNPKIVRGLDYYTKTVFEFISGSIGAQSTVCGGGRYDGLVAQMGGPQLPALGFALGMERILMVAESSGVAYPEPVGADIYIAPMGHAAQLYATDLGTRLRAEGFSVLTDISGRGLKAQMKYANKCNVRFTAVIGDDELASETCKIKNMATGEETETEFDRFVDTVYRLNRAYALKNLENALEE